MKTFSYIGISTAKRRTRVRYTNDTNRVKTLERTGHTDIVMFTTPYPMCKLDAASWLASLHDPVADPEIYKVLNAEIDRLNKGNENAEIESEEVAEDFA